MGCQFVPQQYVFPFLNVVTSILRLLKIHVPKLYFGSSVSTPKMTIFPSKCVYHLFFKTRQDKTRQDKTRQDKTRQDKTRHTFQFSDAGTLYFQFCSHCFFRNLIDFEARKIIIGILFIIIVFS